MLKRQQLLKLRHICSGSDNLWWYIWVVITRSIPSIEPWFIGHWKFYGLIFFFQITGLPHNVEIAKNQIIRHIIERCGDSMLQQIGYSPQSPEFQQNGLDTSFHDDFAVIPPPVNDVGVIKKPESQPQSLCSSFDSNSYKGLLLAGNEVFLHYFSIRSTIWY